jgi:predicted DNA-binding protein
MMHRFGTSGTERMRVVNYYMNEIIEVLISDIHKYFLTCSVFSQQYNSPNQQLKPIDIEVMRLLGLDPSKLHSMIHKFKDRFNKEAEVFKDLTQ